MAGLNMSSCSPSLFLFLYFCILILSSKTLVKYIGLIEKRGGRGPRDCRGVGGRGWGAGIEHSRQREQPVSGFSCGEWQERGGSERSGWADRDVTKCL